eukprot:gnl/MRDRNA2_/MRDRNA2_101584_c0_seq1.p1 gnl/MRDRNA2_/MRDRNA2_101584_c0~~gnl/MRDRNA2_/MRDRNA2_101584_c0_seq1.p1  ORF type:complete len:279 (-),score=61.85 gnl/MRDRNA2_/MRDRNA2_101584_c0_seq1:146-982(-)
MGKGGGGKRKRLSPEEDAKRYRDGYPDLIDDADAWDNVRFHQGEIPSRSMDNKWPADYIDAIHSKWWGDYGLLERHHSWVQWLFPIREQGVNRDSQPLTCAERDAILADAKCKDRFMRSYELAMDFYGFSLADRKTGELTKTKDWEARFSNLNTKTHNFLRLTRILKWLGEFELTHYQAPLVRALASGVFEAPYILKDMGKSLKEYFIPVVKNDAEREALKSEVTALSNAAGGETQHEPAQKQQKGGKGGYGGKGGKSKGYQQWGNSSWGGGGWWQGW